MNDRKLIDLINAYAEYIDERVLWIRSSRPLAISQLSSGRPIHWLVRLKNWRQVGDALAADARSNPLGPIGLLMLIPIFWYTRRRFHSEIGKLGQEAHRSNYTRFLPTSRAFVLTLSTSLLAGGIVWYFAQRLGNGGVRRRFSLSSLRWAFCRDFAVFSARSGAPLLPLRRPCGRPFRLVAGRGSDFSQQRAVVDDRRTSDHVCDRIVAFVRP